MKVKDLEKEVINLSERIDKLAEIVMRPVKMECNAPRTEEIQHKTYEIVKRMAFNVDMKRQEDKIEKVNKEIEKMQKEKEYLMLEADNIQRKYYQEY